MLTGARTLWTAHNIEVNSGGVGQSGGGRNGSRWYEIGGLTGTPTLQQAGTLFDPAGLPLGYWIPSVALSRQGHMALVASRAGAGAGGFASVAVSGRLRTDSGLHAGAHAGRGQLHDPTTRPCPDKPPALGSDYLARWAWTHARRPDDIGACHRVRYWRRPRGACVAPGAVRSRPDAATLAKPPAPAPARLATSAMCPCRTGHARDPVPEGS